MKAFIFDSETSGLVENHTLPLEKQPEIVEFYGASVDLETGEILHEIDQLFRPRTSLTDENVAIHNITNEMLVDAPPFASYASEIRKAIERHAVVIGHNLSFDKEMVNLEFERVPLPLPNWSRPLCTVEASVHLKGYRLNLQGLHELLFGERFKEAHRAKPDTQALIRCCVELFKRGEI